MKLSIDIGNGYVKAINEEGKMLHFPTVIKENIDSNILKSKNDYEMQIDGINYYIGDLAIIKRATRRWENSKTFHQDTKIYIALCSSLLSETTESEIPENKIEIELCLGLPYSYYITLNRGKNIIDELSGIQLETEYHGKKKSIHISKISVFPQGIGAYFSNLYDITGTPYSGAEEYLKSIFIDIGYRTVDVVSFEVLNNTFELIEENSFSLEEYGIFNAINNISKAVSKDFEITLNDVEYAIQHKNSIFENMYGEIDLSPISKKEYANLADKIVNSINLKLSSDINKYRHLFLTGGGAVKLYDFIKERYPNLILQKDYIFCNAKGYLALENTK